MIEIKHYLTESGVDVFDDWFAALNDDRAKLSIRQRITRMIDGNFGTARPIRKGVWELKVDVGAGYRVYYAKSGQTVVLLLCGGDKRTQASDIDKAVKFWENYQERVRRST